MKFMKAEESTDLANNVEKMKYIVRKKEVPYKTYIQI